MLKNFRDTYSEDIKQYSMLPAKVRNELALDAIKRMQQGDRKAFETFLLADFALIYKLYLRSNTVVFADVNDSEESEMYFIEKLYTVLMRFDFSKGTQISTFIYKSLQKDNAAALQGSNMIPVSMSLPHYMFIKQLQSDYNKMRDLGYSAQYIYKELARRYNKSEKYIRTELLYLHQIQAAVCLDEPITELSEYTFADIVADKQVDAFVSNVLLNVGDFLADCKQIMNEQEYFVFVTHLGLLNNKPVKMDVVRTQMHLSKQRVYQIYNKAVGKARRLLYTKYINVAKEQAGFDEDYAMAINPDYCRY